MKEAKEILNLIEKSKNIVITSHRSPDGDSIGSSMGLYFFIEKLGIKASICHPDPCPGFIEWAKNGVKIYDYENEPSVVQNKMDEADLIFCLDYNGASRLGRDMQPVLENARGTKVMIDHHLYPDDFVDIVVSQPDICSTSQLIYELIESSGKINLLDAKIGTPIYLGIMTDTGSFRYSSVTSRTHEIIAVLLKKGVQHTEIHEATFDNNRIDKMKLRAHIIAERLEIFPEWKVAVISVTENELKRFNSVKGDTEGVVNEALSIEGIQVAVFFREDKDMVKISFRSKGNIAVNTIANECFNGGGHKNAAGGSSFTSVEDAITKFKEVAPKYF